MIDVSFTRYYTCDIQTLRVQKRGCTASANLFLVELAAHCRGRPTRPWTPMGPNTCLKHASSTPQHI